MINKLKLKYQENIKDKDFGEIFTGSVLSFGGKLIGMILGYISSLIVARYYGASAMGILALINSFFAIALVFGLLGTNTLILRFIPEYITKYSFNTAYSVYKKILLIVFWLSCFVTIVFFFTSDFVAEYIFKQAELAFLFALAALFVIFKAVSSFNINTLRALKSIKLFVFFQVFAPFVNICFILILTYLYFDKNNPVYAVFYSSVVVFLFSIYFVHKLFKQEKDTKSKIYNIKYKEIISTSFPMFLTAAAGVTLVHTDVIMIGIYLSTEDVGVYAIAIKLALLNSLIIGSINTIVAPKFSELYHNNNIEGLKKVAQKTSIMIFYTTLLLSVFLIVSGEYILGLFGAEFTVGYFPMVLVVLGRLIAAISGSVGYFMNMTGNHKLFSYITILSVFLNILLNILLIPEYGINGAAFASAFSMALMNLVPAFYIKHKMGFFIGYIPKFK